MNTIEPSPEEEIQEELLEEKALSRGLTQKSLKGLGWTSLGTVVQMIAQIVVLGVLARVVTKDEFGLANIVVMLIGIVNLFGQLGFQPALIQLPNLEKRHIATAFTLSLLISSILTAGVYFGSSQIAGFFKAPHDQARDLIALTSIAFMAQGFSIVAGALHQREFGFKLLAMSEVISFILGYGVVGITLAYMGKGTYALVAATIGQVVIRSLILVVTKPQSLVPGYDGAAAKQLISFGAGHTLADVANYVATNGDNFTVGRMLGMGSLGSYGQAYRFSVLPPTLFGRVVNKVLFSGMARLQEEKERLASAYARSLALVSLISIPVAVVMCTLSPEIVRFVLGTGWDDVVFPLQVLLISVLPRMAYKVSISLITSSGQPLKRAMPAASYAIVVVGGAVLGARLYGINGVAVFVAAGIYLNDMMLLYQAIKICGAKPRTIIEAYLTGLPIGLITLATIGVSVVFLRSLNMLPLAIILIESVLALAVGSVCVYFFKDRILGKHGIWASDILQSLLVKLAAKMFRPAEDVSATSTAKSGGKYQFVDALRGIAILAVMVYHTGLHNKGPGILKGLVEQGSRGVQLFFLMSGFTLLLSHHKRHTNEAHPTLNYYLRRAFRIAPAFYLGLVAYWIWNATGHRMTEDIATHDPFGILMTLFPFVAAWHYPSVQTLVPGGWSISVETAFYAILPLLFLYVTDFKKAFYFTVAAIALAIVTEYGLAPVFAQFYGEKDSIKFLQLWLPGQLAYFGFGFILYYWFVSEDRAPLTRVIGKSLLVVLALVAAMLVGIFLVYGRHDFSLHAKEALKTPLKLSYGAIFLAFAMWVANKRPAIIVNKFTTFVGLVSFSSYVTHFMVIWALDIYFPEPKLAETIFLLWPTVIGITVGIAYLIYKYVETPGIKLGKMLIERSEANAKGS